MPRKKADDQPKPDPTPSYTELRSQLEAVVLKLQDSECDVDEAVALYGQALELIKQLEQRLETAENRVTAIQAQADL